MSITHRVKRLLGISLAGAMVLSLMPAGIAAAQTIETESVAACDLENFETPEFNDSLGFFQAEIECMASYGITLGDAEGNYNSTGTVTRQQMALFIARLASQALNGNITDIPEAEDDAFDDIADINPPEARDAINWLAELNITVGAAGGDSYNPSGAVTRQQMASFIKRAHDALGVDFSGVTVEDDVFDDVDEDNVHAENINTLAAAGVVAGTGDGSSYSPAAPVTRGQMSAFIVRSIGVLESQDLWNGVPTAEPIEAPVAAIDFPGPQLASASVNVATATQVSVDYTFTDPVLAGAANITPAAFHLFSVAPNSGPQNTPFISTGNSATRVSADTVRVTFTSANSAVTAAVATAAGVSNGAVVDADGYFNPEGSVAFNSFAFEDGNTLAPDLIDVGEFDIVDDAGWFIETEFTFDTDADLVAVAGDYYLIQADGTFLQGNDIEGDGEAVHTVLVGDDTGAAFGSESDAEDALEDVVRGFVDTGSVEATIGANTFVSVPYTVEIDGGTDLPNLVSVELDAEEGTVDFVFDTSVQTGASASAFLLVYGDAGWVEGDDAERTSANTYTVEFADLQVNALAVGAIVVDGGVTGVEGSNVVDSVRFDASFAAGEVAVSTLESVTIEVDGTDIDLDTGEETVTSYTVTVQYDGPVTAATPVNHFLYVDDVDVQRYNLDANATLDAATDFETGTIVLTVDSTVGAQEDLFEAIDEGEVGGAGVAYGGAEVTIARDFPGAITLETITKTVGIDFE